MCNQAMGLRSVEKGNLWQSNLKLVEDSWRAMQRFDWYLFGKKFLHLLTMKNKKKLI